MILTVGRKQSDLFLCFQIPFFLSRKGFSANMTSCSLIFQENFSAEWERIFRMHIKDKGSNKS